MDNRTLYQHCHLVTTLTLTGEVHIKEASHYMIFNLGCIAITSHRRCSNDIVWCETVCESVCHDSKKLKGIAARRNILTIFKIFCEIRGKHVLKLYAMSDREPTRWQHNRIYPQPLHTHNSLRVNDRDCFHPGLFPDNIT